MDTSILEGSWCTHCMMTETAELGTHICEGAFYEGVSSESHDVNIEGEVYDCRVRY